ncbi:FRG domain-containing protein [Lichenibacterium dinghuense]|uniref:FRG domain-containing protein n=1 Tax=Lichenibacterium dinghuense TaxID=2895977 RepID=UPI001F3EB968|nr:FRG domain-containing protein [Lichenibacterium sp. 6Y81]
MVTAPSAITHTADSTSAFIDVIKTISASDNSFFTFRGEAKIEWQRLPTIMRPQYTNLLRHERDATRDLVSVHPHEFDSDKTMFDRLVRMQHYGLPTRLMDVTGNPLVALFNASEEFLGKDKKAKDGRVYYIEVPNSRRKYYDSDTISCVANLCNLTSEEKDELFSNKNLSISDFNNGTTNPAADRLLQFIREEKSAFRGIINGKDLDRLWYVVPKLSNRRIIAQNGAFMIFGLSDTPRRPVTMDKISFQSIKIPELAKGPIRKELATLGITESALFPEIDKAASFIKQRYQ